MVSGVERRTVTRYFATRVIEKDDGISVQRKGFACRARAWEWVARAALFDARNERCTCGNDEIHTEFGVENRHYQCKLCDPELYVPVVKRLARIMRHRANNGSELRK